MSDLADLPTEFEKPKKLSGKSNRRCLKQKISELFALMEEFREEARHVIEETKEETKNDEWEQ